MLDVFPLATQHSCRLVQTIVLYMLMISLSTVLRGFITRRLGCSDRFYIGLALDKINCLSVCPHTNLDVAWTVSQNLTEGGPTLKQFLYCASCPSGISADPGDSVALGGRLDLHIFYNMRDGHWLQAL